MKNKEIGYWDYWNTTHRSGVVDENSTAGQLGAVILREISSLHLTTPRIVEIGCGTGWIAQQLPRCGAYLGFDLSPKAIEEAQRRFPGGRFLATDFLGWDSQGELFSVALLVDSIAYFHDQDLAVAKTFAVLERHGYLVLSTVNPFVYSRMSWVGQPAEGQVRKWLSRENLHSLLQRGGFRLLRSYTVMPAGDLGILRVLNTPRLNRPAQVVIPADWIKRAKELCGLGQYRIVVAQRLG